jgi:hypothetical protein
VGKRGRGGRGGRRRREGRERTVARAIALEIVDKLAVVCQVVESDEIEENFHS